MTMASGNQSPAGGSQGGVEENITFLFLETSYKIEVVLISTPQQKSVNEIAYMVSFREFF